AHAVAIGKLKNGAAYRPEREAQVLRRVAGANRGPLSDEALLRMFTEIVSGCRSLEQPLAIAFLGPAGTFSEMALGKQFGASNAEAARVAANERSAAAIGPEIAAERYKLKILARSIEDDAKNRTRFLVLGSHDAGPSGRDRTSLVMTTHNKPGSLHDLIASFSTYGVNMTRLESRPARTGQWEYYFYVDIEGHQEDPKVAQALAELRGKAPVVKIFGSYPAAVL